MSTKLLALKKRIKARLPEFKHPDWQKRKEVGTRWRRPRGLHSKMRHGIHGRPASVNPGYRTPAELRGMTDAGLLPVLVYTATDFAKVDAKKNGVIIGSIGSRLKAVLLQICKDKGFKVLNVKDVDATLKDIAGRLAARKEAKKESLKKKETKAKQKLPKKEEMKEAKKESVEEAKPEQAKEQEKKEMDKVLTRKE